MISTSPNPLTLSQYQFLIIGYGNELRGDDAVGAQVALAVADWNLPAITSIAVHQLTPELAAEMERADYVIFVDACGRSCAQSIQIAPIVLDQEDSLPDLMDTHYSNPKSLLYLTQRLYGYHPQAWLLQIPTECFDIGEQLSSTAQQGCDRALRTIEQFFSTYQQFPCLSAEPCMKSA